MKYEMIAHYKNDQVKARIEWDGSKIVVDNKIVEKQLRKLTVKGMSWSDGLEFLKVLPFHYRNGYVSVRRTDA